MYDKKSYQNIFGSSSTLMEIWKILKILSKMDYLILFEEINIFISFFIENILYIKELLSVMFLVVFNGINYYEDSIRIFIKLERCMKKESKFMRIF